MSSLIYLLLAASAGLALLFLFIGWESKGQSGRVVAVVLTAALIEALVQRGSVGVPVGLWRIPLGPLDARPIDVLLPMGLVARAVTRTNITRISMVTFLWLMMYIWYTFGAYWGYYLGNDTSRVVNQYRGMSLILGTAILVGGLDAVPERLRAVNQRIGGATVWIAAFVYGFRFTVVSVDFSVPVIGSPELGLISSEASLILACVGLYVLLFQLLTGEREFKAILGAVLLVFNPLLQTQAASIVALGVMVGSLFLVSLTSTWRQRVHLTGAEMMVFVLTAAAVGLLGQVILGDDFEVVDQFEQALFSDAQGRTSEIRVILWTEAVELVRDSPLMGQGVGHLLDLPDRDLETGLQAASHNVFVDMALRTGLPGLLLFVSAIIYSLLVAWRQWLRLDGVLAAAALAAFLAMVALLAKGMAESALDQFRQATTFGIALGIIIAISKLEDSRLLGGPAIEPGRPSEVVSASRPIDRRQ